MEFREKYRRNIPLVGRDKFVNGLGLALQRTAFPYRSGRSFTTTITSSTAPRSKSAR